MCAGASQPICLCTMTHLRTRAVHVGQHPAVHYSGCHRAVLQQRRTARQRDPSLQRGSWRSAFRSFYVVNFLCQIRLQWL